MAALTIKECTTGTISLSLKDEAGAAIPLDSLLTVTLTMKDVVSGEVINGWDEQDIKNANGVTVDASSNVSWPLTQDDTVLVNGSAQKETHRVLVDFTYDASGITKRFYEEVRLVIKGEAWVP